MIALWIEEKVKLRKSFDELLATFRSEEAELVAYLAKPKPNEIVMTWPKENYLCVSVGKGRQRPTGAPVTRATVWPTVCAAQATMSKYGPNAMGAEPQDKRFVVGVWLAWVRSQIAGVLKTADHQEKSVGFNVQSPNAGNDE